MMALEMDCDMSGADEFISVEQAVALLQTLLAALDRMGLDEPALHVSLAIEALKASSA